MLWSVRTPTKVEKKRKSKSICHFDGGEIYLDFQIKHRLDFSCVEMTEQKYQGQPEAAPDILKTNVILDALVGVFTDQGGDQIPNCLNNFW